MERALKLFGTTEPVPETVELAAGPVTVDLENGALRGVRLKGVEVMRGISFTVRDHNWSTAVPELSNLRIERQGGGFRVTFDAVSRTAGGELPWHAEITGGADGSIAYEAVARPKADFATNRTGFIVLHPLDSAVGKPVEIEHVDGSREPSRFPELISAAQCFFEVAAMTHEPLPGVRMTCRMEGDAWECEDHRNWTDASYKTYVRPLSRGWPYTIPGGGEVRQAIRLTFSPSVAAMAPVPRPASVAVELAGLTGGRMPEIGLGVRPEWTKQALAVADTVRRAGVQLLNCRLDPRSGDTAATLAAYRDLARRLAAQVILEVVVPGQDPVAELARVAAATAAAGLFPRAVAVSAATDLNSYPPGVPRPPTPGFAEICTAARAAFPGVTIGGGMFSYFTELNRIRPSAAELDYVMHATGALIHAADDRSVMETLEALPHVIRSTRAFIGNKGYRVGPANMGMPFNPYGAATTPNPGNGRVTMAEVEPRQRGLFGAAWAAGYLAEMTRGGVDGVTLFAPAGAFGIVHVRQDHPQPGWESAPDGALYPAFHVLAGFAALAGAPVVASCSADPTRVQAVACRSGGATELWLANLTPEPQKVALAGLGQAAVAVLDESSFDAATRDPGLLGRAGGQAAGDVTLAPYAVARLTAAS
jgi:hypothetical protein